MGTLSDAQQQWIRDLGHLVGSPSSQVPSPREAAEQHAARQGSPSDAPVATNDAPLTGATFERSKSAVGDDDGRLSDDVEYSKLPSALTPKTVEQKPYVGGAPVVFGWRKDRSAANGPLKIGETVYDKGIGVHSYCKLTYDLNGEYVKFISDVGMDASAPAKSECAWKMVVDGKESVAGVAKAGGEKRVIRVDVTGAKVLELVCDFGPDDDDAGDRLDFAKARLIKP